MLVVLWMVQLMLEFLGSSALHAVTVMKRKTIASGDKDLGHQWYMTP